jgi:hypothetical protein
MGQPVRVGDGLVPGDAHDRVVLQGQLTLPVHHSDGVGLAVGLDMARADEAGVLGDRDGIACDQISRERDPLPRLLIVGGLWVLVGVAAHEERSGRHVAHRRHDDLDPVHDGAHKAQLHQ